jgi:hypothetical protein
MIGRLWFVGRVIRVIVIRVFRKDITDPVGEYESSSWRRARMLTRLMTSCGMGRTSSYIDSTSTGTAKEKIPALCIPSGLESHRSSP